MQYILFICNKKLAKFALLKYRFSQVLRFIQKYIKYIILASACLSLISCASNKSKPTTANQMSTAIAPETKNTLFESTKTLKLNEINLNNLEDQNLLTQLLIAEVALTNQKFDTALEIYWRLAQEKQSAKLAQRSLYIAQFIDIKTMLQAAELWAKLAKNDKEAQKIAAGLLLEQGLYLKSLPYLENLAKLENSSNYMLLVNSMVSKDLKNLSKILPTLQRSEADIKPNPDLFTALAFVYHYLENQELTTKYLNEALKLDKNFLSAILLKANILKREQNFKKAEKLLINAQKRNPHQIKIYLSLAKLQIENGKKDLAKQTLQNMIKYADKDEQTTLSLANYLYSAGMLEEASLLAQKLLESKKYQDRANLLLAQISFQKQEIDATFKYLNKVKITSAGFIEASYLGAIIANEVYGFNKAQKWLYEKKDYAAQNLTEDLTEFLLTSYKALTQINADKKSQKKWLDEAISLISDIGLDDSELIYARAFYWYEQKDMVSMEADLRNLVENNPKIAKYLNTLAYILVDEDKNLAQSEKITRYEEGLSLAQKAYELENSLAIKDTLGWALYKNNRFNEAKIYLEQAHKLSPKDDEIATHLILVLWAMGENKSAKNLVQEMLSLQQENKYLKKILEEKPYLKH